jgi:hypothetical protein
MKGELTTDDFVTLYRKASGDRNVALQALAIEAAQQFSVAEGMRAFADEAGRLVADEAALGESLSAKVGEAAVGEALAIEAGEAVAAEAAASQVGEFGVGEAVAVMAAEALAAEAVVGEAMAAEAMETAQSIHQFLSKI